MGIGQFADQNALPHGTQEYIDSLKSEIEHLAGESRRFENALAQAIVNKDAAENQTRLCRLEIDRLLALISNAKATFDDIASVQPGQTDE